MSSMLIAGAAPPDTPYDADIIILAMDRIQETLEAIDSAASQKAVQAHVLVFDQGSSPENLACLAAGLDGRRGIGLYKAAENFGVAGGRNRAAELGRGRVIFALDNDAEFGSEQTVADAVARLDEETDLAAIGFRILVHSSGEDDLSSWGYATSLLPHAAGRFETVTFVGAGHAISRNAWSVCGGYDDRLFFCWEEFDFCLAAISAGWRIRYDGDLVVRHKVSPDRRFNWTGTRWFYYVRNRLYIGHKWQGWPPLLPRMAGYVLRGARNGLWKQTAQALPAAWRLGRTGPRMTMSPAGAAYLARNDAAHRGRLAVRLKREVFAALPGHGMKAAR